jgi:site-specific recombinase XerD
MKPTDFARHLTKFLVEHLPGQRNVSPNTIKAYRDVFILLLRFCRDVRGIPPEKLSIKHLDAQLLMAFIDYLEKERRCSPRTQNHRLAAFHGFFRYLQVEEPQFLHQCQRILAISYRRHEKTEVQYLTPDDMKSIMSQPDLSKSGGRRDAVLIGLLYDTGARVQEIIDILARDVRLQSPAQIRLTGKGRKTRVVPLIDKTVEMLGDYMKEHDLFREEHANSPLFFNRRGERLSRSGIRYILDKHANSARKDAPGIQEKISPHTLRHTKAMHTLQAGGNIVSIQHILGHADLSTTRIYTTANINMKREALEKAAGLSPELSLPPWQTNKELMDWLRAL